MRKALLYRTTTERDSASISYAETRDSQNTLLAFAKTVSKIELPFSDSLKNSMKMILNAQYDNR